MVDLGFRVRDRRLRTGPGEADLECGKQDTVDADGLPVAAPDPGVPQALSGLERLDVESVIIALHVTPPAFQHPKETWGGKNQCDLIHIRAIFSAAGHRQPGAWLPSRRTQWPRRPTRWCSISSNGSPGNRGPMPR